MRKIHLFFFLGLLYVLMAACSSCSSKEDDAPPQAVTFEMAEEDLVHNFEKGKSTLTIPVQTDLPGDAWTVESHADWCLVAKSVNGKGVTLSVAASEEPEVRNTTIDVKSTLKNYTIKISQLGYGPAILLKTYPQSIDAAGGEVDIVVTANVAYKAELQKTDWLKESAGKGGRALVDYNHHYEAATNGGFSERQAKITFSDSRTAEKLAEPVVLTLIQKGKEGKPSDVIVEGDIKIVPTGGKASEAQPGSGIDLAFDGKTDPATHYHSDWYDTKLPVTLEFFFEGNKEDMDYILYYTRNGNGNFGKFDLYLATESAPDYKLYGSYDFNEQGATSRIDFSQTQKAVNKVKFVVKSGLGGFVSCAEMEFYGKNREKTLDTQLLGVFKDITCTELKEGVTDEDINRLPAYFGQLATAIRDNTYDEYEKEFRIQNYAPYSIPEVWSEKLMTKNYSFLDNPTGIYVEKGDSLIILVGDTYGQRVSVQNIGDEETGFGEEATYKQTAANGESYFLEEGVNKIGINYTGMLFVIYTTDLTSPTAKPIKIHIPMGSGKVGGYFDLKRHKTNEKYKELIDKSAYKYFCVRGENIIFYFHRVQMKKAVPYDILSAIELWDNIVGWQQELMGIDDVRPSQVNNHLFAISPEGSYMWASDYRVAFVYTYLDNILLKDNVMAAKDNAWGPAHEIGHIHQKAINWPSSTESSNNLFSNYILYKLGKYCSRGSALSELATARFVNQQGWYNMGDPTHQNESTEIHMRMNWQLWNYYHRCGYKPDFWQQLFKLLRENRIVESDPGAGQLLFAKMACKAANEDLTDFFDLWGFFIPVDDVTYEQYGLWQYNVTEQMIADARKYMAQFPKPKHAFQYLEDRKAGDVGLDVEPGDVGYYMQFKDNQKITKQITCTFSGQNVSIKNGDEAVAFEIYRNGKLVYFSNRFRFELPAGMPTVDVVVYAVQADGNRIEVGKE
ncbi:M60 family metallopeptidase [Phocaeicola sp.]